MARGIILRGADLADVSDQIPPLVAFVVIVMTAAILRFRKQLD